VTESHLEANQEQRMILHLILMRISFPNLHS
jgi:hypothetical protein